MSTIFTHGRIGIDFSPADAVAITPDLHLADVFSGFGAPFQAALAAPGPRPAIASYCELTGAQCASAVINYESLFPVPSANCGGCRKVSIPEMQNAAWYTPPSPHTALDKVRYVKTVPQRV